MYSFAVPVPLMLVLFQHIIFLLCFGTQFVATQPREPNNVNIDLLKYRNAIVSGVENLFASKEVLVKNDMRNLFYKGDDSLRDDVNFNEVVVCQGKGMVNDFRKGGKSYKYLVCPDDAGSRWPSYNQLIRDSSSENAYCCGKATIPNCCSKEQLYREHPELHPMNRPSELTNITIKRGEEKPPEKMATSTIVIIVSCSIAGLLILVAIACLICCLCDCCCFAMFNKNSRTGGKIAGGYATNAAASTPGAYPAGGYGATAAATAYPAAGGYPSGGAYPAGSGGYAGGYAGGYPANVR